MKSFQIGNFTIQPNLILAPMSGVTNSAFRRLIRRENPGAVGLVVTEFISVEGLTRANKQSLQMMRFHDEERPISIQIFGHDIERMSAAAQMVEEVGADIVDVNCGCPVPKVVKRGGGCELMRQPHHLEKILKSIKARVKIPLTLKIRSGWDADSRNAVEISRLAQDCGVAALAVHGRTRSELYRGSADWSIVNEVARSVNIPVIGSGDIDDAIKARQAEASGVKGLMIGRAALENPWIFTEIQNALNFKEYQRPSDTRTIDVLESYLSLLKEDFPDKAIIGRMKQLGGIVTKRVTGSSDIRRALCMAKSVDDFEHILRVWRNELSQKADYPTPTGNEMNALAYQEA